MEGDLTKLNAQVTFSQKRRDVKVLLGQACIPSKLCYDNGETTNQKSLKKFYKKGKGCLSWGRLEELRPLT